MPNDYRAIYEQYARGMQQPGQPIPMPKPGYPPSQEPIPMPKPPMPGGGGFNFLEGWSASPHAGYLPPRQPQQHPIQYGKPTTGGWIGGPDGQPIGSVGGGMSDPRAMLHDGIRNNFRDWQNQYQGGQQSGASMGGPLQQFLGQQQNTPQPNLQANYGMQQYDQFGKPIVYDQVNPGRTPKPDPWGGG